ncbi:MAG: response regulator [Verrucomicrobiota bacterium]
MPFATAKLRKRLLIIEDDEIISNVYRSRFERAGYEVEICADGQSGFYRLHESVFDAVVLDLMLPQMNGADILGKIRVQKRFETLPVIVLTNSHLSQLADRARKAGANEVFSKATTTPAQVVAAVNSCLGIPTVVANDLIPMEGGTSAPTAPAGNPAMLRSHNETKVPALPPPSADVNEEPAWILDPPMDEGGARPAQNDRLLAFGEAVAPTRIPLGLNPPAKTRQALLEDQTGTASVNGIMVPKESDVPPPPSFIKGMHGWLKTLNKTDSQFKKLACLYEMVGLVHPLTEGILSSDALALRRLAEAFEALLWELHENPTVITQSTLMTLAKTTDYLAQLLEHPEVARTVTQPAVLVVDDDLFSRRAMIKALEQIQIKPIAEESPECALEKMQHTVFDLVITDVNMPGMSGFDLCKRLHATPGNRATPVIFVTVQDDFQRRTQSVLSGGNEMIAKPYLLMELGVKALVHLLKKPAAGAGT